jgi:hypothetical protein
LTQTTAPDATLVSFPLPAARTFSNAHPFDAAVIDPAPSPATYFLFEGPISLAPRNPACEADEEEDWEDEDDEDYDDEDEDDEDEDDWEDEDDEDYDDEDDDDWDDEEDDDDWEEDEDE